MEAQWASPATEKKAKNSQFVNEMRAKRGLAPLPDREEEAPDENGAVLPTHLHWIWEAFTSLSRTRIVNQTGPQPITPENVLAYCTLTGLDTWESLRVDLFFHITVLDIEWMKKSHASIHKSREDAKKEAEQKARKPRGRRR